MTSEREDLQPSLPSLNMTRRAAVRISATGLSALAIAGPIAALVCTAASPFEAEKDVSNTMPDPTFYDRMAIRELIEMYADRLNHADWEGYAHTLAEDIEFRVSEPDTLVVH